ncbi:MAG: hypothetical protein CO099_10200 [Bdellovibrio sp. CG_4_9_14_3_um_filter_39_7]|nr:MAG: hypothetical protein CO099_10200 [Bdellovibrio sp. CG_4_9_14_3_um_filter_39_7]
MSLSSGMNANVVKTALDSVVFTNYEQAPGPSVAGASDPVIFVQDSTDRAAVIEEAYKGVGFFAETLEEQDIPSDTPRVAQQKTFSVIDYWKSVDIPKRFLDDELHGVVSMMMRDFGLKARRSADNSAMKFIRDGFTVSTTADAAYLFSASHSNIAGDTIDNLSSAALAEASLEDAIVALMEQKDQAGEVMGVMPRCLLVPPKLFKTAVQLTASELEPETGNNAVNWISLKYSGLMVKQSPYLGAAAGGSDSAWYLIGENHNLRRFVRSPFQTTLVPWETQRNNNYIYKGGYREVVGALTYEGLYGSTGVA